MLESNVNSLRSLSKKILQVNTNFNIEYPHPPCTFIPFRGAKIPHPQSRQCLPRVEVPRPVQHRIHRDRDRQKPLPARNLRPSHRDHSDL